MEETSKCLLLAASLHTVVDIDCLIDQDDIEEMVNDPHITIVYDGDSMIPKDDLLNDIREALGDYEYDVFMTYLKDSYKFKISSLFYLDVFETDDSDWLVLRMKGGDELSGKLKVIHDYIVRKYRVKEDYPTYKPHVSLAKLKFGTGKRYLENKNLARLLEDSRVGFEDIVFSEELSEDKYDK